MPNHYENEEKQSHVAQLAPKKTNNRKHLIHFQLDYILLFC